ncbi:MAG: DNA recombination protein RmuC [Bacillota bacterium]|nr:DNA recombination protein RmuC [Bacillota bacterium]
MNSSLLILIVGIPTLVLIIFGIAIIVKLSGLSFNKNNHRLEEDLRNEIDRSRQETIAVIQNSMKNMAGVISRNQKDNADLQNRRLAEMNRNLSESLEQVNRGLGEMQSLAMSVGDLKKILGNVKTRGIVGEIQLGAILEQILSPQQYDENVAVTGTSERVEFAVKFPGEGKDTVYLPIDSKFPADVYFALQKAYEKGDRGIVRAASDNLKNAILKSAKDIRNKYIMPPYTTEFAVMFLPFEGLYAEVLRLGMVERLQQDYHVAIAGPTTMAAMLNSFNMGFRSLALQKQSGQVWDTLSKVRTEFDKFAEVLEKTQKRLEQTQSELEKMVGVRTRSIQHSLETLDTLQHNNNDNDEE